MNPERVAKLVDAAIAVKNRRVCAAIDAVPRLKTERPKTPRWKLEQARTPQDILESMRNTSMLEDPYLRSVLLDRARRVLAQMGGLS